MKSSIPIFEPPRPRLLRQLGTMLSDFSGQRQDQEFLSTILDAYLDGKRGADMPHGIMGQVSATLFEEVEKMAGEPLKEILLEDD